MTPERWQKVKAVLQEALELAVEQRPAFLDRACSTDQSLRHEVESLLSSSNEVRSSFMKSSANAGLRLSKGSRLGDFEVISPLGSGGMGEVYRARDHRLERDVALKVLPRFVSLDPERLHRFAQEAKAAAALDHPNILAVFHMGTYEGAPYLVSELLQGETLREQVTHGPIPLGKAIDYGVQIAHGLAAAHEKGIVHRDLKPENLFITKDGRVKILDFGLAKLARPESDAQVTKVSLDTEPGAVLGTVGYMSPEQARGEELDARSDIFSFGAVLFEMATGQQAFTGKTSAMTFKALLDETPVPPTQLNKALPQKLGEIVGKALEKDRDLRYQSAAELRTDLKRLKRDADSGQVHGAAQEPPADPRAQSAATTGQPSTWSRVKRYGVLPASIALLATTIVGYRLWLHFNTPNSPAKITQISQWDKPMRGACLSPDGHAVAFGSSVDGIFQVFLMLTSGGEPLQITNDEGDKLVGAFSADGNEVYYTRIVGRDELWAVPTLGGSPRRVAFADSVLPSPDGNSLFYTKSDNPAIFRVGKSGLNEELVYKPQDNSLFFFPLLLFPGGNNLLAGAGRPHSPNTRIFRISLTSHEAVDLGEMPGGDVAWAEPGVSIFLSREVNGLTNIWKYGLQDRSLTQITFGTGADFSPMPDPGGKGIYYLSGRISLFSGRLTAYHAHSKQSTDIVPDVPDGAQPIISLDGKRLMYVTFPASTQAELWTSDIDGGNKAKISQEEALVALNWAPDNFHLSFSQGPKLYIVGADGKGLRQLPSMGGMSISSAVWSPDQKSFYIGSVENAQYSNTIWKWNEGSDPETLVEKCGIVYDIDPGGKYLLALFPFGEKTGVYEVPIAERKCIPLLPGLMSGAIFAPDGKSLFAAGAYRGQVAIYRQSWIDGKVIGTPQVALKVPFTLTLYYRATYDFSRDLSTFVYTRPGGHADLFLLSQK